MQHIYKVFYKGLFPSPSASPSPPQTETFNKFIVTPRGTQKIYQRSKLRDMQLYEYFGYFIKTIDQKMVFDETGKVGV